jgi:hypothetical protein
LHPVILAQSDWEALVRLFQTQMVGVAVAVAVHLPLEVSLQLLVEISFVLAMAATVLH